MYKYNLKANPELAKERHREQNRAWYRRNKEKVMEKQREYRQFKQHLLRKIKYDGEGIYQAILDSLKQKEEK